MDFPLNAHLLALLLTKDCADWIDAHARSGAAPAFNEQNELVFRFADADEARQFEKRWLAPAPASVVPDSGAACEGRGQ